MAVGNMARSFTYDVENRQVSATVNSNTATYAFDGNGQRVSRAVNGVTTFYVYDAFGALAVEYSTQPVASACGTDTCYPVLDHLGSTRLLTDGTGSTNVRRYDYQPFGGEIPATFGGRTEAMGYPTIIGTFGTA